MRNHSRTFSKMGRDGVYFHIRTNEAHASLFEAVDTAQSRAQIALAQMCIRQRALFGCIYGA